MLAAPTAQAPAPDQIDDRKVGDKRRGRDNDRGRSDGEDTDKERSGESEGEESRPIVHRAKRRIILRFPRNGNKITVVIRPAEEAMEQEQAADDAMAESTDATQQQPATLRATPPARRVPIALAPLMEGYEGDEDSEDESMDDSPEPANASAPPQPVDSNIPSAPQPVSGAVGFAVGDRVVMTPTILTLINQDVTGLRQLLQTTDMSVVEAVAQASREYLIVESVIVDLVRVRVEGRNVNSGFNLPAFMLERVSRTNRV